MDVFFRFLTFLAPFGDTATPESKKCALQSKICWRAAGARVFCYSITMKNILTSDISEKNEHFSKKLRKVTLLKFRHTEYELQTPSDEKVRAPRRVCLLSLQGVVHTTTTDRRKSHHGVSLPVEGRAPVARKDFSEREAFCAGFSIAE